MSKLVDNVIDYTIDEFDLLEYGGDLEEWFLIEFLTRNVTADGSVDFSRVQAIERITTNWEEYADVLFDLKRWNQEEGYNETTNPLLDPEMFETEVYSHVISELVASTDTVKSYKGKEFTLTDDIRKAIEEDLEPYRGLNYRDIR